MKEEDEEADQIGEEPKDENKKFLNQALMRRTKDHKNMDIEKEPEDMPDPFEVIRRCNMTAAARTCIANWKEFRKQDPKEEIKNSQEIISMMTEIEGRGEQARMCQCCSEPITIWSIMRIIQPMID